MSGHPDANTAASPSMRPASPVSGSPLPLEFATGGRDLDSRFGAGHGYCVEDRGNFDGRGIWALALLWLLAGVVAQALVDTPGAGLSGLLMWRIAGPDRALRPAASAWLPDPYNLPAVCETEISLLWLERALPASVHG